MQVMVARADKLRIVVLSIPRMLILGRAEAGNYTLIPLRSSNANIMSSRR